MIQSMMGLSHLWSTTMKYSKNENFETQVQIFDNVIIPFNYFLRVRLAFLLYKSQHGPNIKKLYFKARMSSEASSCKNSRRNSDEEVVYVQPPVK